MMPVRIKLLREILASIRNMPVHTPEEQISIIDDCELMLKIVVIHGKFEHRRIS